MTSKLSWLAIRFRYPVPFRTLPGFQGIALEDWLEDALNQIAQNPNLTLFDILPSPDGLMRTSLTHYVKNLLNQPDPQPTPDKTFCPIFVRAGSATVGNSRE